MFGSVKRTTGKSIDKTIQLVPPVFVLSSALLLSACGGGGGGVSVPSGPGILLSKTTASTTEDGTEDTFSVVLGSAPTSDVEVTFKSRDLTEGEIGSETDKDWGFNYYGETVDFTFTPANWNVPQTIKVLGKADGEVDGNQSYDIATTWIWSMDLNYIGITQPTVSVTNTDTSVPGVTVSAASITTAEDGSSDSFNVSLNVAPTAPVEIPITISDASEGSLDYYSSTTQETLTLDQNNWDSGRTVYVYGVDDESADGNQTYNVTIGPFVSTDTSYNGLTGDTVSVTNTDNDTAAYTVNALDTLQTTEWGQTATFSVVLNTEPTGDVSIPVTSPDASEGLVSVNGGATGASVNLNFTSLNWQTPQEVTVTPVDDANQDGDINYNITVGAPTGASEFTTLPAQTVAVTNVDDDTARVTIQGADLQTTENAGTDTFIVSLAKAPIGDVVINVTSNDTTEGRVKGGSSQTTALDAITLTFTPADWQTPQTVTVVGQDDFEIDSNQSFTVDVVIDTALTLDAEYDLVSAQAVSVTNADNDVAGLAISGYVYAREGGANDSFTVKLNTMPVADVIVFVSVEDPNEFLISSNGIDFASTLDLTFTSANWSTGGTITVQAVDDDVDEGYEYYDVTMGPAASADPDYNGLPAKIKSIEIGDNDTAGFVITPNTGLATSEAGTSDSFTLALSTEPVANVFVTVSTGNIAEGLLSGGNSPVTPIDVVTLEFTPSNWGSGQTVTVHGQDDAAVLDGPIVYDLTVAAIDGADANYNYVYDKKVGVTNSDNEVGVSEIDVPLTLADLPHTGQVAPASTSTYTLSGLTAGWKYTLTAGNVTDDIALEVNNTTTPASTLCTSTKTGAKTDEFCSFTMPDDGTGTVSITIDGIGTENGAEFTLSMSVPTYAFIFETYGDDVATDNKIYLYDTSAITDAYYYSLASGYGYDGTAVITRDLTAGETYYLKVMPIYSDGLGAYRVQVTDAASSLASVGTGTGTEGEPDNDATSAAAMILNTPLDRYLSIGDEDWFVFTVPVP